MKTSENMLETARKERTHLQLELQKSPLYQRLSAIDNLIAAYGGGASNGKPPGKGDQIRKAAAEFVLSQPAAHAKTDLIHQFLGAKGLHVSIATLSSYLSDWDEFIANRKLGWSIRSAEPKEG